MELLQSIPRLNNIQTFRNVHFRVQNFLLLIFAVSNIFGLSSVSKVQHRSRVNSTYKQFICRSLSLALIITSNGRTANEQIHTCLGENVCTSMSLHYDQLSGSLIQ